MRARVASKLGQTKMSEKEAVCKAGGSSQAGQAIA